jgi:membrane protease subunit (stomatin/prohibitin family)
MESIQVPPGQLYQQQQQQQQQQEAQHHQQQHCPIIVTSNRCPRTGSRPHVRSQHETANLRGQGAVRYSRTSAGGATKPKHENTEKHKRYQT